MYEFVFCFAPSGSFPTSLKPVHKPRSQCRLTGHQAEVLPSTRPYSDSWTSVYCLPSDSQL